MDWQHGVLLVGSATLAGMVNSVAGGGTLLTFPSLMWALQHEGIPNAALIANATSTVALLPGALSSLWGYREELGQSRRALAVLAIPSLIGGIVGAELLLHTQDSTFKRIVPFLILLATLLFIAQEPLTRWMRARQQSVQTGEPDVEGSVVAVAVSPPNTEEHFKSSLPLILFQLLVAVYGGFFGAGIGIMMLAALGLMGFTNIHRMNALKNINGFSINVVAALLFLKDGLVDLRLAGIMAAGAIFGGYFGAGTARKIGQQNVRRIIILIGFAITLSLLRNR